MYCIMTCSTHEMLQQVARTLIVSLVALCLVLWSSAAGLGLSVSPQPRHWDHLLRGFFVVVVSGKWRKPRFGMCCALIICLDSLTFQPWIFLSLHNISALEVIQFRLLIVLYFGILAHFWYQVVTTRSSPKPCQWEKLLWEILKTKEFCNPLNQDIQGKSIWTNLSEAKMSKDKMPECPLHALQEWWTSFDLHCHGSSSFMIISSVV